MGWGVRPADGGGCLCGVRACDPAVGRRRDIDLGAGGGVLVFEMVSDVPTPLHTGSVRARVGADRRGTPRRSPSSAPLAALGPDFEARVRSSFARQTKIRTTGASLRRVAPGQIEIEL